VSASIITVPLEVNMPTLPGFNHEFGSLHQAGSPEMSEWLRKGTTFNPFSLLFMFTTMFPPARLIVCHLTLNVMEPMSDRIISLPTAPVQLLACTSAFVRLVKT